MVPMRGNIIYHGGNWFVSDPQWVRIIRSFASVSKKRDKYSGRRVEPGGWFV